MVMGACGWFRIIVGGCGWLWEVVGSCGWLWVVVGGYGWLWVVEGGCRWLWVVACFSITPIFLLMFLPLFSKLVTNILKIYELPKIYKIFKKLFTIIIYQVNSMSTLSGF